MAEGLTYYFFALLGSLILGGFGILVICSFYFNIRYVTLMRWFLGIDMVISVLLFYYISSR